MMRDKRDHLEQEVLQYRQQNTALQERLDSVTEVTDKNLNNSFPKASHDSFSGFWHIS